MNRCLHTELELLPEQKNTLRCRHCYLTMAGDELVDGFCRGCLATSGNRRYDFDEVGDAAKRLCALPIRGMRRDYRKRLV
jgi:hypothetical protein